MDVSIIIVNFNTKELILPCIQSIYEKTISINFEIIVVDNNSSDNSIELITKTYPEVIMVKSKSNLGFGKANNLGYKYSKGKYIFLLNPDTLLVNNAIEKLHGFLKNREEIAIVGGQLLNIEGQKVHSFSLFFPSIVGELNIMLWNIPFRVKNAFLKRDLEENGYAFVSNITGADMMLRRKDVEECGLFDPDFFMYFEETELSYRFYRLGRLSAFIPSAEIIHLEGVSFSFKEERETRFFEGRRICYKKIHSTFYIKIANILYTSTCILAFLFSLLSLRKVKQKEWMRRLMIFKKVNSNEI